jgi:hypothetical protein
MPKISINDKDYYTDDFNEDQLKMYNELTLAKAEVNRLDYLKSVLEGRMNLVAAQIQAIAEQPQEEADEAQTSE